MIRVPAGLAGNTSAAVAQIEDSMGEDVFGQLRQVVAAQFGLDPSKVTPATSFVTDLGADSLDTVELIMAIEQAFDVAVPEAEAEAMCIIQDVVNYIELQRARRQHAREP